MEAEGGGVGVGEGEGAGVGHVVPFLIVVGGGQLQAVALLAAVALGTPVSQLPRPCERAAQFHVLPIGVLLLAVDGDGLAGLPFAHTRQCAVGLEGEAIEVTLRVADVLVVPCADHERPVLLIQLHGLFVCLRFCEYLEEKGYETAVIATRARSPIREKSHGGDVDGRVSGEQGIGRMASGMGFCCSSYKNKTTRTFEHRGEAWRVLVDAKVVLFIESTKLLMGNCFLTSILLLLK